MSATEAEESLSKRYFRFVMEIAARSNVVIVSHSRLVLQFI
jgi:hypothetical protein